MRNVLSHSNVLGVQDKYAADVVELAKILSLPKAPVRIEGYDISNLFGQEAVGSMVVFKNGEPDKSQYRKFKIRGLTARGEIASRGARNDKKGDDTGMLKEILERRFNNDWAHPDLIIIDGGKGQLNAALSILKKLKLDIPALAVSRFICPLRPDVNSKNFSRLKILRRVRRPYGSLPSTRRWNLTG